MPEWLVPGIVGLPAAFLVGLPVIWLWLKVDDYRDKQRAERGRTVDDDDPLADPTEFWKDYLN